uniref:Uncharacterized protein n=1 Tax=Collybia nuda TaxID=64659 RepID=A0A9P5Y6W1_9AGAR|nr:hypothetical protein BDZ94DRAFT_1259049 [Collybia nuda]
MLVSVVAQRQCVFFYYSSIIDETFTEFQQCSILPCSCKRKPESQLVYYQRGIGTYNKRQFLTRLAHDHDYISH